VDPAGNHQAELEVASEDEGESHATDCTEPEGSPPARGEVRPMSPKLQEAVALRPSGAPTAQPPVGVPSVKAMAAIPGGKRKSRTAKKAARAALKADSGHPLRVATKRHRRRGRSSARCSAARGSTPQATARPSWT
jgi:hypothetical protein